MLQFAVDEESVTGVLDYLEQTRQNIMAGIRSGMQQAMEGLAWTVADKLQGSPIVSRSGELLGHVLGSPKVTDTPHYIKGTVDAELGKKHLGLWLEAGTNVPSTIGTAKGVLYQFTPADGDSVFTRGHRAFSVKPHPFMNPSLIEYKPTIIDIITQRITEAAGGLV
jgi:hypothetical protein